MNNIKQISSDGFGIDSLERSIVSFASISLRTAIRAYFSTFKSTRHYFNVLINPDANSKEEQKEIDWQYNTDYIEQYAETIVHFQHFIELVCKEILRKEHELLVLNR